MSFKAIAPRSLAPNVAYDMLEKPIDWQSGVTTIFIGTRKTEVSAQDFLARLAQQ